MPLGEIYVDDVLITDVLSLPERKVQGYDVARGIMLALSRDYTALRYVRVQVPGNEHPDLMANYQYRFYVRIGDFIVETYASGQIIEDRVTAASAVVHLATMIRREFQRPARGSLEAAGISPT